VLSDKTQGCIGTKRIYMNRIIRKVAVLGSGVMGSRIACHFANIGLEVILLDIVPMQATEEQLKQPAFRNKIVNESLQAAVKQNPSPVYAQKVLKKISTGNFDDDLKRIAECDWVIEVIIENLDIKKQLFDKVDALRKPGTLITSNTSGIPIALMCEGRSADFRKHFCGTHFFNPPRYLRLLEIIPGPDTDASVIEFLMDYGDRYLGKTTVLCKDTPAFIANRVGVFGMMAVLKVMEEMQFSIAQVEALTGPVYGRPKSATFRTADVVGIDTFVKVAQNTYAACPNDESRDIFQLPSYIHTLVENKWLGDKTGQGFFKKVKNEQGQSEILTLNLQTLEYAPSAKAKFAALDAAKPIDDLKARIPVLHGAGDKASEFYNKLNALVFRYVSHRIPEIADELYKIDDAMRAGFGWELGPFEIWDLLGVERFAGFMQKNGTPPAAWVNDMIAKGCRSFYTVEGGKRMFYDIRTGSYVRIPGMDDIIVLDNYRAQKPVWKNSGATLHDIGDGILNLEFHTKMNVVGSEILEGIQRSIDIAEKNYRGLVIGHQGADFSLGANLGMVFMYAIEQDYDELDFMVRAFQNSVMRIRYSGVPIVVCPQSRTLGGGCEMTMHADLVQAAAETYIGLVEVGVGLIPGGGGTKEFTKRVSDMFQEGDVELNALQNAFMNIATAKVALSAEEAREMGVLREQDRISVNKDRQILDAKAAVIELADAGYTMKPQATNIRVQGRTGMALFAAGVNGMKMGRYVSEHDAKIAMKIANIMCGGDLSYPQEVSEQYLLDLEREAFVSLCGERKTLERIQSILTGGKPLRN